MCPEQCLLPSRVRQHVGQEFALSALAAGPQTLLCYPCHTGTLLGTKRGTLSTKMSRCFGQDQGRRKGTAERLSTLEMRWWGWSPTTAQTQSNVLEVHGKGQMPQERLQMPRCYLCAALASGLRDAFGSQALMLFPSSLLSAASMWISQSKPCS